MTRADWLQERKQGVGGSDVASLLNVGYGCRRRLWYDKVGVEEDYPFDGNKAARLGTVLEPYFAEEYAKETGRRVEDSQSVVHCEIPQLRCNIDRQVWMPIDVDGRGCGTFSRGVLEIKSVGRGVFYNIKREGLPEDYILQLQHGMLATGWSWGAYCIGNRDSGEIIHWDVQRSEAICSEILAEVPKFWASVEQGRMWVGDKESCAPPRLEPDDRRCQSCQWRRTCQGNQLIQLDTGDIPQAEELRPLLAEYDTRKDLFAQAEILLDETTAQLKADLGDRQAVKVGDRKVYFRPQEPRVLYDGKGLYGLVSGIRTDATGRLLAEIPPVEMFVDASKPSRPLRIY